MSWLRIGWLAGGFAFVGLVVYLSLTPDPLSTPTVDSVKTGHVLAYGWLAFWFAQLGRSLAVRGLIAVGLLVLGIGLEFAQQLTGYRTYAVSDMVDDAIGVAAGLLLATGPGGRVLGALEKYLRRAQIRR